ncbi:MAG: hypothetical protein GX808_13050 [Syntrophomonadaceae bacterium]|jgi:uncharacterized membrane protein YkvI|nr:hypothetical protein [Syntrophomonadaceae bacterium]
MPHQAEGSDPLYIKSISSRQIAMAFTGSFLGAGFVSGQELTQFFAVFGSFGVLGMFFAVLMLFILGCLVMKIAKRTGFTEFDKIIVEKEIPWLRAVFGGVFIFFLFGLVVVMAAGAGALLNQVFAIPTILGSALMIVFLALIAMWEAKGVLTVFSITVPLLIVTAMICGVSSFFCFEGENIMARPFSEANPLLGNWLFSTITFVSYNMMAAVSILVPIASEVKEEKTIDKGILQGAMQLMIVFVCILIPLILHQTMLAGEELPMLTLAENIHPVIGIVYAILLFCGMFGSALSCLFGVTVRIKKIINIKTKTLIPALVVMSFIGSIAGFKELIAILLPICGYIGFLAMIGITMHFVSLQKKISIDTIE